MILSTELIKPNYFELNIFLHGISLESGILSDMQTYEGPTENCCGELGSLVKYYYYYYCYYGSRKVTLFTILLCIANKKIWNTCLTIVEPVIMIRFLYITGYHSSSVTCQNANSCKIEKMFRVGFGASINFLVSFEAIFVFRLWWQLKKIDWVSSKVPKGIERSSE